jgi:hypothetical protein
MSVIVFLSEEARLGARYSPKRDIACRAPGVLI